MANTNGQAQAAFEAAKQKFGDAIQGLKDVKWEELPGHVKEHIEKHPRMTIFQIAMFSIAVIPGIIAGPALGILGFSSVGPVAGSAAAAFQSANGATAGFAVLQSAAMGGYGAAAVNSAITAGSMVFAAGSGVVQWFVKKDVRTTGGEEEVPKEKAENEEEA